MREKLDCAKVICYNDWHESISVVTYRMEVFFRNEE